MSWRRRASLILEVRGMLLLKQIMPFTIYPIIAAVIFGINVVPFFMPATWMVVSFIAVHYGISLWILAFVGAFSATLGRFVLAKLAKIIVREQILSEKTRRNIDDIKTHLEKRQRLTFGVFLLYALSPFPSNQLFIAYGLTNMPLKLVTIPFFLGRLVSYFFLSFFVVTAAKHIVPRSLGFSFIAYFFAGQILTIITVYLFTKINWHKIFVEKKLEWMK
jgi:membrane protein YqaA with SNARE-associated domain